MEDNIVLLNLLRNSILYGDGQSMINIYAQKLARNIAGDDEDAYQRLLNEYGYKELPEKNNGRSK